MKQTKEKAARFELVLTSTEKQSIVHLKDRDVMTCRVSPEVEEYYDDLVDAADDGWSEFVEFGFVNFQDGTFDVYVITKTTLNSITEFGILSDVLPDKLVYFKTREELDKQFTAAVEKAGRNIAVFWSDAC